MVLDALQQLFLETLDEVLLVFAPDSFFEFLDRRNLQLLHLALKHGFELVLHLLHDLEPEEFLELAVLEGVEVLEVVHVLTRIEAILRSLELLVFLLEFLMDAIILNLILWHLELYSKSLALHLLVFHFSAVRVILLTCLGMIDVDVASITLGLILSDE